MHRRWGDVAGLVVLSATSCSTSNATRHASTGSGYGPLASASETAPTAEGARSRSADSSDRADTSASTASSAVSSSRAAAPTVVAPPGGSQDPSPLRRRPRDHRVAHVFVPLCDNEHQGIVRVSKTLGDGRDLQHNLYWGAGYGMRTFLEHSSHWKRVPVTTEAKAPGCRLERIAYVARQLPVYLVADAYDGACMAQAMADFLESAAGRRVDDVVLGTDTAQVLEAGGRADVVAFVGHDGLMDLPPPSPLPVANREGDQPAGALVVSCFSQHYFSRPLEVAGCPLWVGTTGLLSAEAYSFEAALWSWAQGEPPTRMRVAAGEAYAKYQNIERPRGLGLFANGYAVKKP